MLKLVKTTVTGGLIFLLPVAVLLFLLGKIFATAQKIFQPLADRLPVNTIGGISATIVLAVLGIIAVSFLAGLFARTRMAQRAVKELEDRLLGRVPAYGLLKSLSANLVAPEKADEHPVVLVRFDDSWQVGIWIDDVPQGGHTIVFLPDSPTPQAGTVMIVESSRVRPVEIPLAKAFSSLSARGNGLAELLGHQAAGLLSHRPATAGSHPPARPA